MNTAWQLPPPALREDSAALGRAVEQAYREIYDRGFRDDLIANHNLPIQIRAPRLVEGWQVMLLLTPWMLARLLFPVTAPAMPLPAGWSAAERREAESVVLGAPVQFFLVNTPQKAHLNYHPQLGHYLIQPLILAMGSYATPEEVFAAWNEVIRTRDENMKKMERECQFQQEVSRREFFRGLVRREAE